MMYSDTGRDTTLARSITTPRRTADPAAAQNAFLHHRVMAVSRHLSYRSSSVSTAYRSRSFR
nr:hypothetical protein [Actinomadura sp. KC216]